MDRTDAVVGEATVRRKDLDGRAAGKELIEQAAEELEEADFGFVFCSHRFDLEGLVAGIDERMNDLGADWIGCTTAGEISRTGSTKDTATVLLVESDKISFSPFSRQAIYDTPESTGKMLGRQIRNIETDHEEHLLFTLIPGTAEARSGVEYELLSGITAELPTAWRVVGGSAADGGRRKENYQFCNGTIHTDAAVSVAIQSDVPIRTVQGHGMTRTLATGVVNDTDGKVIERISGQPAAEWYADAVDRPVEELSHAYRFSLRELLDPDKREAVITYLRGRFGSGRELGIQHIFQQALIHPLAVPMGAEDRIITPFNVTDDNGLIVTGAAQPNQPIKVLSGDRDDIIAAGETAFAEHDGDSLFGIVADCTCRNQLFSQEERDEEVQRMRDAAGCPIIGFYGYGEIGGPEGSICTFKNQTVSGFMIDADD